jgi:hypothetical protein
MLKSRDVEDMIRRFPAPGEPDSARSLLAEAALRVLCDEANGCPAPARLPEGAR